MYAPPKNHAESPHSQRYLITGERLDHNSIQINRFSILLDGAERRMNATETCVTYRLSRSCYRHLVWPMAMSAYYDEFPIDVQLEEEVALYKLSALSSCAQSLTNVLQCSMCSSLSVLVQARNKCYVQ